MMSAPRIEPVIPVSIQYGMLKPITGHPKPKGLEAAMTTLTADTAVVAEDVGNILSMEHVNVRVPDQSLATLFYVVGLGFTRDPYMNVGLTNMWVNIGDQQFHLPTGQPQVLRGHVGLVVPDLEALERRLAEVREGLAGTAFGWSEQREYVAVTSPWGNQYRCYGPGRFGAMTLGIPYVEFSVQAGAAPAIQRFYQQVMSAPGRLQNRDAGPATVIEVGPGQELVFQENETVPEYDGHHIAIYVAGFSGPYQYLDERKLITEGVRNHQFRFQDIIDPESDQSVFAIEHEVRSIRHPGYRRQLVNRDTVVLA